MNRLPGGHVPTGTRHCEHFQQAEGRRSTGQVHLSTGPRTVLLLPVILKAAGAISATWICPVVLLAG